MGKQAVIAKGKERLSFLLIIMRVTLTPICNEETVSEKFSHLAMHGPTAIVTEQGERCQAMLNGNQRAD